MSRKTQALRGDVAISWADNFRLPAIEFAQKNKLPIINELDGWRGLCFHLDEAGWSIETGYEDRENAFVLQLTPKYIAQGKDPLLRAMGSANSVLDLTAGWGGDSLHIAQTGRQVVSIEREIIVFQLLKQAWSSLSPELAKRLRFLHLDGAHKNFEQQLDFELESKMSFDLVYLDPMFQFHTKKRAKSRKPMQIMQQLAAAPSKYNESRLFENAMKIASQRVVVKRALKAAYIDDQAPQGSIKSKLLRFDLYKP